MLAPAIFYEHAKEPEILSEFLSFFGPGFFVDVGANEPKNGSQTWDLEQCGWTGVLIEPQPDLAQKLREQRAAKVYAVACSAPERSGTSMTLYLAGINTSLNPDYSVPKMVPRNGAIDVPVKTLDEVLADANAPAPLDFVAIDVESHEIDVLKGFDLDHWRPKLLLVEDIVLNLRLHRYLRSRKYKWVRRTAINSWYVPESATFSVSLFGRWQFARKYYLSTPLRHLRDVLRKLRTRLSIA
jgi:FkbM family methyltransferase